MPSTKTASELQKFSAERTAVEWMIKWVRSNIVSVLLKNFGPMRRQSALNKQVRWAPKLCALWAIWHEFIIKVYPALINWASIYDGKKRHRQHLQHFRPRCAHNVICWVKHVKSAAEENSSSTTWIHFSALVSIFTCNYFLGLYTILFFITTIFTSVFEGLASLMLSF